MNKESLSLRIESKSFLDNMDIGNIQEDMKHDIRIMVKGHMSKIEVEVIADLTAGGIMRVLVVEITGNIMVLGVGIGIIKEIEMVLIIGSLMIEMAETLIHLMIHLTVMTIMMIMIIMMIMRMMMP